jgi:hypothetical protein
MPANGQSLRITDTYRQRLRILRARAIVIARAEWAKLDPADLDGSHDRWVATVAATLTELQRGGARLSAAYLSAFLSSELGRRVPATGAIQADDEVLEVHPSCSCSKEPVVADAPDRVMRPTGTEVFERLSAQEQDSLLGPDKAELVRSGDIPLHSLIEKQEQAVLPTVITEAPLEALQHHQS